MPGFYTHYTFVRKNTDPKDEYASIRALGAQGPDIFFFCGYSLAKREKKSQTRYFGTYLHHINISDAYSFLLEYAAKQKDSEVLFAYLKGLFMHYVMDRNCHPYIFYRSGFSNNSDEKAKYMRYHFLFEAILDSVYSKNNRTFVRPSKCIKCKKEEVKSVSKMFFELARHLKYSDINKDTFYNCYKDALFGESGLYSPTGFKKFFFHTFMKDSSFDCLCPPAHTKKYEKYDVLNLKHSTWLDCISGAEHNESFLELVDKAINEIPKIDAIIALAKKKASVKEEVKKFANNIDHDGFEVDKWKKHYELFLNPEDKR